MRLLVRAEPDVISPNPIEAEELVGHEVNDEKHRMFPAREIVALRKRSEGCVARR